MTVSQLIERLKTLEPNAVVKATVWDGMRYRKLTEGLDGGGITIRQVHRTDIQFGEFDAIFDITTAAE